MTALNLSDVERALVVSPAEQRRRHREIRNRLFPEHRQFVEVPPPEQRNLSQVQRDLRDLHTEYEKLREISGWKSRAVRKAAAIVFNISEFKLMHPSRASATLRPRQIAMAYAAIVLGLPLKDVGRAFNRGHYAVYAAVTDYQFEVKRFMRTMGLR